MAIIYDRLFRLLDKHGMKISEFRYNKTLSSATIAKLRKNQPVNISVLDILCEKLNCDLDDITEYRPANYVDALVLPDVEESENPFIFSDEEPTPRPEEQSPEPTAKETKPVVDEDPDLISVSGIWYKKSRLEYDKIHYPHKFIANETYPNICPETGYAYLKNSLCIATRPDNLNM